jgi:hypothetical protein
VSTRRIGPPMKGWPRNARACRMRHTIQPFRNTCPALYRTIVSRSRTFVSTLCCRKCLENIRSTTRLIR